MRTTKKCAFCGKEFFASEATKVERVPRSGMQKYCCEDCQAKAKEARKKKQRDFMNAVEPVIDIQQQRSILPLPRPHCSWDAHGSMCISW